MAAETLQFRDLPVGPSRHLVRFLVVDGLTFALKEEPLAVASDEYEVLRHLEVAGLPAVTAGRAGGRRPSATARS